MQKEDIEFGVYYQWPHRKVLNKMSFIGAILFMFVSFISCFILVYSFQDYIPKEEWLRIFAAIVGIITLALATTWVMLLPEKIARRRIGQSVKWQKVYLSKLVEDTKASIGNTKKELVELRLQREEKIQKFIDQFDASISKKESAIESEEVKLGDLENQLKKLV